MRDRWWGGLWLRGWLCGHRGDALLYGGSAVLAIGLAATTSYQAHRVWGVIAAVGYAAGAGASLTAAGRPNLTAAGRPNLTAAGRPSSTAAGRPSSTAAGRPGFTGPERWRVWLAGAVFAVTGLLPLIILVVRRANGVPWSAQPEVLVVERSARQLLDSGTPYADLSALSRPVSFEDYTPYLPGMSVFGLPRALLGGGSPSGSPGGALADALTDARVVFALVAAALLLIGLAVLHQPAPPGGLGGSPPSRAIQLVAVLPATTLTLATGGDDLPVLALLLLALACCHARRPVAAGLAGGAALAMKLTAAPVLVMIALALLAGAGRRAGLVFGAVALAVVAAVVLPVALVAPDQLVEHVLRYPAGLTEVQSPAASPLPGHLIAQLGPAGRVVALTLLAMAALAITGWLVRRPPRDAAQAADRAAVALLVAMLLMPATRFGYLVYPVALAGAAVALRAAHPLPRAAPPARG